ncbi:glutamate racemase [Pasteurella skyensis]|uniref:Glutamate racemase n=1 Tax=Phocoenobacter skyensis TaxID=97481 RepID=A0AAJ6NBK4_9PAST|nr:glutamate racemase [Pasteurella skyensis]MDP8163464.1 glutamate racemase [Pasteurella skyensis]MDP8173757.1 glutamate racemase [Pasteurella skyensis]MDP8177286.1 glutamate racemase [Pasteurella skyensis]MDP8179915.1 glutamate racemase [Pasteurella skyensis]MDP8190223.1 glutamate racemase [Pasteurella skyensis]
MKPTILIYDSGMGGLTIYDEIRKKLPDAYYVYCFDNAYFPYSEKSEIELIERSIQIVQKIVQKIPLDLIVVACNTASTVVLPALRTTFDVDVVGTVPAIKPATQISETKTIGLLATKGTVTRRYVMDLIQQYAKECIVEKIGSTDLVKLAEEKLHNDSVDMDMLQKIIKPWQNNQRLDTIVLGCTHFPFVKKELQQLLPNVKYFIDSGKAIANRVEYLLKEKKIAEKTVITNLAYCTQLNQDTKKKEKVMKQKGFKRLDLL